MYRLSFVNFCCLSQSEVSTDNRKVSAFSAFQHVRCRCCYRSYLDRFLMAKPNKFQLMLLGDDHEFSVAVDGIEITRCHNIDLLGVNIDSNKFNFDRRVTNLHSRVNNLLQVIKIFRKLITGQTRLKLYNAFIQLVFVIVAMCGIFAVCTAETN